MKTVDFLQHTQPPGSYLAERHASGELAKGELRNHLRQIAFASLEHFPRYVPIPRKAPFKCRVYDHRKVPRFGVEEAKQLSAEEFALREAISEAVAEAQAESGGWITSAEIATRIHYLGCEVCRPKAIVKTSALVTMRVALDDIISLSREYALS